MSVKWIVYSFLIAIATTMPGIMNAQGVGGAIINFNFGEGRTNPGPALPSKNTQFSFSSDTCIPPGTYTITNNVGLCPADRFGKSIDHTPGSNYGYVMLVHDTPSAQVRLLFVDTLNETLCTNTQYQFSAYMLNAAIPGYCPTFNIHNPRFTFKVEDLAGNVIQSFNTGPMPYDYSPPGAMGPKYHFFSLNFYPPASGGIVLKIEDDPSGYTPCGYQYVIDDIELTSLGPDDEIQFDGAVGQELVKSVCYLDNKQIKMNGKVAPFYNDIRYQWQQSTDNGNTWNDIPGATDTTYTGTFSVADTFLFRMSAGEAAQMSNPNCRVASNSLRVEVNGANSPDISATVNSPVCSGSPIQFNATGGAGYEWTGPNGFSDNVYYTSIFNSSLADSGWYYVDIISPGGCRVRDSVFVKMIGTDININAPPDTAICKGASVQLSSSEAIANYVWTPSAGLSNPNIGSPIATPDATTTYMVKVTDNNGCADSAKVRIRIKNPDGAVAAISGSEFLCRPFDSASIKDASKGHITNWNWSFGNGQVFADSKPPTQYYSISNSATTYTIRLIVSDTSNCSDTAYHILKVVDNCYIAVPTAFTPNGDGLNDYLYPLNAYKATNLLFRVYDRSGQILFETRDWTKKWDGTFRGIPQATAVYVWMLEYTDDKGRKVSLKGTSVLIR